MRVEVKPDVIAEEEALLARSRENLANCIELDRYARYGFTRGGVTAPGFPKGQTFDSAISVAGEKEIPE